jgi:uncharacterized protein (TIGR02452 family)
VGYIQRYPFLKSFFSLLISDLVVPPSTFPSMDSWNKKNYLTGIMDETLETLKRGYYYNSKEEKISLNLYPSIQSLECKTNSGSFKREGNFKTKIILENKDCLSVTQDCASRGLTPLLLDAASDCHFGGYYRTGSAAQEENICRRSGLSIAADPTQGIQKNNFYPLHKQGEHAGLYVAHVPVFRGEEKECYPYLDQPFETAIAIMAAFNFEAKHNNRLKLESNNRLPEYYAKETKEKLRTVLEMAQEKAHKSVILIPFGCGAFCNPPNHICELLMELITQEFPHSFEEIHISILDDKNTGKTHNPEGNYAAFKNTIEEKFKENILNLGNTYLQN